MNTELIILGLISEKVRSGYDIMKRLKELSVKNANIKFGSIYYALKKATANGWIKKTGSKKEGGNPEKLLYQITPEGKKRFKKKSKKYFETKDIFFEADLTLMILDNIDNETIEDRIEMVKEKLTSIDGKESLYLSYIENHLKAELSWLKSLN